MTPTVKLTDLTDSLDIVSEESGAWLDVQTGQVVVVDNAVMQIAESADGGRSVADLADWEEDQLPAARAICAGDQRYLPLPDQFDFHEYRHMEQFIRGVADAQAADQLWRAIKGKGAFRYFKDTADRLGLLDDWYQYLEEARSRYMLDWATSNHVTVDTTPRRTKPY